MGHFSVPDYLWVIGVIGHFLREFSEPVYILNSRKNLPLIMDGKFCGLAEIFHITSQSVTSDHNIPCWNILPLSWDLWTNITESFQIVTQERKHDENLTYLHHKQVVFWGGKGPVAHCVMTHQG